MKNLFFMTSLDAEEIKGTRKLLQEAAAKPRGRGGFPAFTQREIEDRTNQRAAWAVFERCEALGITKIKVNPFDSASPLERGSRVGIFYAMCGLTSGSLIADAVSKANNGRLVRVPLEEAENVADQMAMSPEEIVLGEISYQEALDQLTDKQKQAVVMRLEEGKKHVEIADELGISPQAVEDRLKRAGKRILKTTLVS